MKTPEKKQTDAESNESRPKNNRPANVFDGVLIRIGPSHLVMKGMDGKEASMTFHEQIKSSCDGTACSCESLKPGQKIRVFTLKTDLAVVTKIAALDKGSRFAPLG